MTTPQTPPSPTGRLSISEPEQQYFPGTPQDLAQRRRMQEALAHSSALPLMDFTSIEDKVSFAELDKHIRKPSA
jgi:hypothetical protein